MDRILNILLILVEIFAACLPVYGLLLLLEIASMKLSKALFNPERLSYFERKLEQLRQEERNKWDKKSKELDEKND